MFLSLFLARSFIWCKSSFNRNIKCISYVRTLLIDRDEESFNNVTFYMSFSLLHTLAHYCRVNWIFAVNMVGWKSMWKWCFVLHICVYFMSKVEIFFFFLFSKYSRVLMSANCLAFSLIYSLPVCYIIRSGCHKIDTRKAHSI